MPRLIAILIMLFSGPAIFAASHVNARLVSDVAQIQPGQQFHLGVLLKLDPGWHVYWKNSGESGLPTTVQLKLPEGFEIGPWQYPAPELFELGGVRSYGYADEVMLIAEVRAPKDLPNSPVIDGTVKYLVCSDVCIPGKVQLHLQFPAEPQKNLVDEWLAKVPTQSEQVTWQTSTTPDGWTQMQGTINGASNLKNTQWFPNAPAGLLLREMTVQGNTLRFQMKPQADASVKEKAFESVLSYDDPSGRRRVALVQVPLKP